MADNKCDICGNELLYNKLNMGHYCPYCRGQCPKCGGHNTLAEDGGGPVLWCPECNYRPE